MLTGPAPVNSSDGPHVFPVNAGDIAKGDEEIQRLDFKAADIFPRIQWELVNPLAGCSGRSGLTDVSSQKFDVENPFRVKRLSPQDAGVGIDAENLSAALRIVDGQTQHHGNHRGEYSSQVMPGGAAAHIPAQQLHARAEDHI